ncbi:hypothetical protein [Paenibacillus sp. 79R4]|uniref:hypothetical protein n=1 Tax=Paenibacillus sp. 79R4 TaxID=2212847 RepID=UPI0015BA4E52|nr:hypothetical protein [Paenibacillus sp. 79R4]
MIDKALLAVLLEELEEHISHIHEEFCFLRLDEEKFIFLHKDSGIKLALDYSQIIRDQRYSSSQRILKSFNKKNIEHENKTIAIYEDCGIVSKKQKYSEFLLTYDSLFYEYPQYEDSFNIGKIEIMISEPSSLYKMIFNSFTDDKSFYTWGDLKTIKLIGCQFEELEKTIQQVLFLIAKYDAPEFEFKGDYPNIIPYQYHGESTIWNNPDESEEFDESLYKPIKYLEPIAFYNRARKSDDPIFYYRTLEFFFIINKKSELKRNVEAYNESEDLDKLIKDVSFLYGTKEPDLLKSLLNNIDGVEEIVKYAISEGLTENLDISTFSTRIYNFRNSIVHGKGDTKFSLNIPALEILHPESKDRSWTEVLKRLADQVIKQFCY